MTLVTEYFEIMLTTESYGYLVLIESMRVRIFDTPNRLIQHPERY